MKHLKHLCHSNKILPQLLTKSNQEEKKSPTYRSQKGVLVHSHQESLENTSDPNTISKSYQAQTFPIGSLKVQFSHRNICQYWRNIIWCSVHTHLHSHHMSPKQVISQSFIGVLAKIPNRMSFSAEKKRAKKPNLYQSFWSDWQNRTLDRKSVSEIL